tara:strand:- start:2335 stop:3933 length:1599 start_codon:yes stop_codon:yes gene_type:complete
MRKKTQQLKTLLNSSSLETILEAHNGISAKIVEEVGFKGIWASGLAISSSLGVRDNNELSWTQVLEICDYINDAVDIPILLDGDTGYGNFNNMRRLVKKLEQIGVAGVCIEDKLFPKTNSFISGNMQPLADLEEFCGKIKSGKDTQLDDDFCIVARVEAFIAGWGLNEAIKRAEAYRKSGADAILIHSKEPDSNQIEEFMTEWGDRHPIVIVPTKYFSTPTKKFEDLNISLVIWANHMIRTSISAMQNTAKKIYQDNSLISVENEIVKVSEIFRLQGVDELKKSEEKYLPSKIDNNRVIILAATKGDLGDLTKDIPKTMLKIKSNNTILGTQCESYNKLDIKDINVVTGFRSEKVNTPNINTILNKNYEKTGELYSLNLCRDILEKNIIISYGDIIFKDYVLSELLKESSDISIVVDSNWTKKGENIDYVKTSVPYSKKLFNSKVKLKSISTKLSQHEINGEFIGISKFSEIGVKELKISLDKLIKKDNFKKMSLNDLFEDLNKRVDISVVFISDGWLDIDTIFDLEKSEEF